MWERCLPEPPLDVHGLVEELRPSTLTRELPAFTATLATHCPNPATFHPQGWRTKTVEDHDDVFRGEADRADGEREGQA